MVKSHKIEALDSRDKHGEWRAALLDFYKSAVGIETNREPIALNATTTEEIKIIEYITRRKIEYNTTDGLRIPAFLFVPETDNPVPAVIVYHGHGEGKINAAEGEGTNENALAKHIALELGYVVLTPDSRTFGEFKIPGAQDHVDYYSSLIAKEQLYLTKLMEDGMQDMALLRGMPEVDASRIGVAGISMGCWRALNHSVLHEEIAATILAGLFLPWDIFFSEKHCACQHAPALAKEIGPEDLAAAILPRSLMIQWGLDDKYYDSNAEELISKVEKTAEFLECRNRLVIDRRPGMGHSFSNPEILNFFRESFGVVARNET